MLIRRRKVGCCYFWVTDVSGLLKIGSRETKHDERVERRRITQRELVRRGQKLLLTSDI